MVPPCRSGCLRRGRTRLNVTAPSSSSPVPFPRSLQELMPEEGLNKAQRKQLANMEYSKKMQAKDKEVEMGAGREPG